VMRRQLGWPNRQGAVVQPWAIEEEPIVHEAHLRFRVYSRIAVNGAKLALEDADKARIIVNGEAVTAKPEGWFTDKCIGTVAIPEIKPGENTIEVTLPFGRRTNVEWCYLLGDFGVEIAGSRRTITAKPEKLGFDDITRQLLPHYTGNIAYHVPVTTAGGGLRVTVPHYSGAMVRVELDGKPVGHMVCPPYTVDIGKVEAGEHQLDFVLLNTRENAFGPLHYADTVRKRSSPDKWRSQDAFWSDSYRLVPAGIRTAPVVEEYTEE